MNGAVVKYNVLVSFNNGVVIANDRTLLKEFGRFIEFSYKWCESVFKCMGYVNINSTTAKPIIKPGLIKEVEHTFYKEISEIVKAHNIP